MVETYMQTERIQYLFTALQKKMQSELEGARLVLEHPTTLGDSCELKWIDWLKKYLPKNKIKKRTTGNWSATKIHKKKKKNGKLNNVTNRQAFIMINFN